MPLPSQAGFCKEITQPKWTEGAVSLCPKTWAALESVATELLGNTGTFASPGPEKVDTGVLEAATSVGNWESGAWSLRLSPKGPCRTEALGAVIRKSACPRLGTNLRRMCFRLVG